MPPVKHFEAAFLKRRAERVGVGANALPDSSRNGSEAAIRKHAAFAAITWFRGPPCIPGKTARSTAWACSSLQSTNPERGPASVLCVVEVTKSQSVHRVRMQPCSDEAGEVSHVAEQVRAHLVGDLTESRGLDRAWVRRAAADDELRPCSFGEPRTSS